MSDWQVEFDWDEDNLRHAGRHGITPRLLREVAANDPVLFPHEGEGRSGSHLLVGPDVDGSFWPIVMLEILPEHWRPITGWPSANAEIALYRQEITELRGRI